jgi:hypothetical protein
MIQNNLRLFFLLFCSVSACTFSYDTGNYPTCAPDGGCPNNCTCLDNNICVPSKNDAGVCCPDGKFPCIGEECTDACQECDGGTHEEGGVCVKDPNCLENSCSKHGVCRNTDEGILCTCSIGYAGENCGACATGYVELTESRGECVVDPCDPELCGENERCYRGTCVPKKKDGIGCEIGDECISTFCVDGVCCESECSGQICQRCNWMSSNGTGKCGFVNTSVQDPDNECSRAVAANPGSCRSGKCSGTGYACGVLSAGEQGQPACKRCDGTSFDPVNMPDDGGDSEGTDKCDATSGTCFRCYQGACTYQTETQDLFGQCSTATAPNAGSCRSSHCSGTGPDCGTLSAGEQGQPQCKRCNGTSVDPVYIEDNAQDIEGTNLCDFPCKKCSSGSCVVMTGYEEDTGCLDRCTGCSSGSCVDIPNGTTDIYGSNTCSVAGRVCDGSGSCVFCGAYSYRKKITIAGSTSGAQTNYQMKLTVNKGAGNDSGATVYLNNHAANWSDTVPNDLVFVRSDGMTQLDHWLEGSDASTGTFWVEFNSIPASPSTATFYLCYGNAAASSLSNGANTFELFSGFESGTAEGVSVFEHVGTCNLTTPVIGSSIFYSGFKSISNCGAYIKTGRPISLSGNFTCGARANPYVQNCYRMASFFCGTSSIPLTCSTTEIVWSTVEVDATNPSGYIYTYLPVGFCGCSLCDCGGNQSLDFIYVRKRVSPSPTWGTWGIEETP